MWWRDPIASDLFDLAENMREADAQEIFMLRQNKDRRDFAVRIHRGLPLAVHARVFGLDSDPRAIGFLGVWAKDETGGLCEVGMFARSGFAAAAPAFVRHVRGSLIPRLISSGVRRVECRTLSTYAASRRLLRACGAVEETPDGMRDYAPDGSAFHLFAWRKSDWERPDVLHRHPENREQ